MMQSEVKISNLPPPQHHQEQYQKPLQMAKKKKLEPVMEEDEDPSMLRYESRPGLHSSPLAESKDQLADKAKIQELAFTEDTGATNATHRLAPSRGNGKLQDSDSGKGWENFQSTSIYFSSNLTMMSIYQFRPSFQVRQIIAWIFRYLPTSITTWLSTTTVW